MSGLLPAGPDEAGTNGSRGDLERRSRRLPLALLGAALVLLIGSLTFAMFARSVVYYRTPTEVLGMPGERVRLSGTVVPGTIAANPLAGTVTFTVTDGQSSVPVVFEGAAPDTLKDEAEAVAEGSLGPDGTFRAVTLFAKCPSKFESKQGG